MKHKNETPSVLRDLGTVVGLYRSVVWMIGQRVTHGPDWQQRLFDQDVRMDVRPEMLDEAQVREPSLRR